MVTPVGSGSERRALVLGTVTTVVGSMPVFLTGAMAVQIRADLDFGTVGIGAAVAMFFGTMALTSVFLGRLTDHLGATRALRLAAFGAASAALGIATLAHHWVTLAALLVLSGLAGALAQPAANRLLVNRIRPERMGTAFGLKQSAPPIASMLAGLGVPIVALTVGWRWAFAATALAAVVTALAIGPGAARPPRPPRRERGKVEPLRDRGTLLVLGVGFSLAFASNQVVLAFYVDAAVQDGLRPEHAGMIFAGASLTAVVTRLAAGVACDRLRFHPLRLCALLLGTGVAGLALLAVGGTVPTIVGAVIGLVGTWGFPGVFWFSLVRAYPDMPGRITGAMAPASGGAVVGPVAFGALASTGGYSLAWALTGIAASLSAIAMLFGSGRVANPRATRTPSADPQPPTAGDA